jgi:hypothetical protein
MAPRGRLAACENKGMFSRVTAALLAVCLAAMADTFTVERLVKFLQSSTHELKGKLSDYQIADYLNHSVKMSERLEDRTIEDMVSLGVGPLTLHALKVLGEKSKALPAGKPLEPEAPPVPPPPPSSEEQAAIIDEVRDYALNYSANLPDFICTQVTDRYGAPMPGTKYGGNAKDDPHWQRLDQLTTRLSYFNQKEEVKLILHNSTPTSQDYDKVGGATSYGDYGSMLKQIFDSYSQSRFEWDHWGTLRGRRVMAFHYRVSLDRSQYRIGIRDTGQSVLVAYDGLVEVDKATHKVMRITVVAQNIPADFPVRSASERLDYDYTEISGHTFLLPLYGQVLMSGEGVINRNDLSFHNYRKYSADSAISFDDVTPPPLTDDKTKETVDPAQKPPDQVPPAAPVKKKQ